ncbi:serine/threonine-protein kinase [Streptomyces sp. NPDC018347]|uniref:serine/threonine-protein kinase n=1 Tax=Streptomyces sp. NPDC018347 TaxID=3157193 RepID=UPI0033F6389C
MENLGPEDPPGAPAGGWGRIGTYRLLARLGAGGMGRVYLARSDRGRTVAVKVVRRELAEQEEFRARFRQEVQAARRVGGHWTAPVLDADTEAAVPWVATGYVAGPNLQRVVGHDHGPLPERSVRILAAGLAHALKDIHAAGLVHRDLKPSNVLVTIDGPRVIDFGIARALQSTAPGAEGLTRTGSLVGSPGFMAPEQVRGDRVTPACDVFCLGSVLAYAATGVTPFGSADSGAHALMFRIAQEEPDLTGVPEGIADLVRECLRKDPESRPSPDLILERTGVEDTVIGGRSRDPWLPSSLVAQLGRHAVRLLEVESPEGGPGEQADAGAAAGADAPGDGFPLAPPVPAPSAGVGVAGAGPAAAAGGDVAGPVSSGAGGSPEHAAVSDGGPGAAGHRSALAAGQAPPAGAPPVPPGFGAAPPAPYGAPHSQPPYGYGYPQQAGAGSWGGGGQQSYHHPLAGGPGSTPPYGPSVVGVPMEPAEPERRSARSTVLLVLIALVVALGAGGSVYALMNGGGTDDQGGGAAGPEPVHGSAPPATSAAPTPTAPEASASGTVPDAYLGTWRAVIGNADGTNSRELTIRQGEVGDAVLTLVADGPAEGGGSYHCVFEARLTGRPGGGPLEIGPSTVTTGTPATACTPGEATEITLLPDGRLKRTMANGGGSLTYTRR